MPNEKLYLTIDTKLLNSLTPEDTTIYFKKEIPECYTKVCLKNIDIHTSSQWLQERGERCFRIRCSIILNQDDNLVNGEKSDVLALLFCRLYASRMNNSRLGHTCAKLIKTHSNSIRIYLSDISGNPVRLSDNFDVIYELEFSQ